MNKQNVIVFTSLCVLTGCSSTSMYESKEETVVLTTPISQTSFSEEEAENVFNSAVRNHCRVENQTCTVNKVVTQGDNIYGTYTYNDGSNDYVVTGTLLDVQVSKNDSSIVTIGRKEFSSASLLTKETNESNQNETNEETTKFDIPSEVGDHQNEDVFIDDGTYKVRLLNIESGAMNFNGTWEGEGTFYLYILSLDQSQRYDLVTLEGSGTFDETTSLEPGWYYSVVERYDGLYTMDWSGM